MGGSERFWVGKYDGGGGLSEKVVFWTEIVDKAGGFGGLRFLVVERRTSVRNSGKGSVDGDEWIDGSAFGQIVPESGEQRWQRSQLFWLFSGELWLNDGGRCLGFDGGDL